VNQEYVVEDDAASNNDSNDDDANGNSAANKDDWSYTANHGDVNVANDANNCDDSNNFDHYIYTDDAVSYSCKTNDNACYAMTDDNGGN